MEAEANGGEKIRLQNSLEKDRRSSKFEYLFIIEENINFYYCFVGMN